MSKLAEYFEKLEIDPEMQPKAESLVQATTDVRVKSFLVEQKNRRTARETFDLLKTTQAAIQDAEEKEQLDLVLKFLEPLISRRPVVLKGVDRLTLNTSSLFQLFLDLASLPENVEVGVTLAQDDLLVLADHVFLGKLDKYSVSGSSHSAYRVPYSTLVVTENADLHSAVDVLGQVWTNSYVPWVIRDVLVQENVQKKFFTLLEERFQGSQKAVTEQHAVFLKSRNLQRFRGQNLRVLHDTFVVGIQRAYVEDLFIAAPVVTVNVFRTTKEAVALYNKVNGGSATIWSENITETLELSRNLMASNVWINCHGVLNPQCPYTFGGKIYGSELHSCFDIPELVSKVAGEAGNAKVPEVQPLERAFFEGNLLFTVTSEPSKRSPKEIAALVGKFGEGELIARTLGFSYKTIVTRFGQTFAN